MVAFERPELTELKPRITVVGVGGAGGNAVANMIESSLDGVEFVVANTDAQALATSAAGTRIQLGHKITQGLGAGARPEIGRAAAEENHGEIEGALEGSHMCFITAGMGGGTGTGAAPVIAQIARERGILTVGVVTKPFSFEGAKRARAAESGIAELQKHVDTLIVIPNQNLFLIADPKTTFKQAFELADQVLHQGVRGITDLMMMPGLINLDFADVRTVMSEMGKAMMGTGEAEGDNRAIEAANKAVSNPLLDEVSLRGAKALLINITGGDDMGLMEVDEAANHIRDMVDADANIIFGSAFNPDLDGKLRVSVVATGIEAKGESATGAEEERPKATFGTVSSGFGGFAPAPQSRTEPKPAPAPAPAPEEQDHVAQHDVEEPAPTLGAASEEISGPAEDADVEEVRTSLPLGDAEEPEQAEYFEQPGEPEGAAGDDNVTPLHAPSGADELPPAEMAEAEADEADSVPVQPEPASTREGEPPQASSETQPRGPSLFERMTAIGRGTPKAKKAREDLFGEEDRENGEEGDPMDIPAFFKRQVND
ncbi:cell division protein FtsZ [Pacificimonas flava]|uniref:Cell division protein FtsZ n=2 Tax=Pacificimonas TaxID=1960290 RepID=A0A219B7T9_9SPHN|nr:MULTISPECIES: cell division protein FtsZ [Pacificimonas]MBZ6378899.1 cell division protein FtsZ [Pacificimonas aurantium]OWV33849.1 cell division protein FtsZ [Pacificimonas flava]